MFQGDGRDSAEENYERKLELIRAVREENRMNRERIGRRHRLFYGEKAADEAYREYDRGRGYGASYAGNGEYGAVDGDRPDGDVGPVSVTHLFALRMLAAAMCVLLFWGLKEQKLGISLPFSDTDVRGFVAEDFSKQVVDYISDFPYTFGYEKTSIE